MIFKQTQGGDHCSYCKTINCSCGAKHSAGECGCKKSASGQSNQSQSKEAKGK